MARFTHRQLLLRRHISDLASRALAPTAMGKAMLTALEEVVHADHGGLGTVDPASLLAIRVLAIWPGTQRSPMVVGRRGVFAGVREISAEQLVRAFLGSVYLRDPEPLMLWPSQLRAGLTLVIRPQTEKSLGLPPPFMHAALSHASREWYETNSPVGGTLRTGLWTDGRCVGALAFGRDDPEGSFRPSEIAFVRAVSPTIARGLRLALDRESMAAAPADGREAPGLMLLDRNGRPVYVSPAGRRWLNVLGRVEQVGEREPSPAVLSAVAALRTPGLEEQHRTVWTATPAGWLRVEATDGGDGQTAVIMSPATRVSAPAVPSSWALTPQEQLVVGGVLIGLSNRQIADRLHLAPSTVKSHLAAVYEKLEVGGRGGLLARYLREGLSTEGLGQSLPDR